MISTEKKKNLKSITDLDMSNVDRKVSFNLLWKDRMLYCKSQCSQVLWYSKYFM